MDSGQVHKEAFHKYKNIVHERKRDWRAHVGETYGEHKARVHAFKQSRSSTGQRTLLVSSIVLVSVGLLAAVTLFTLGMVYKDKILPGVRLAGLVVNDGVFDTEELNDMVLKQASKVSVVLRYKGAEVMAGLTEMGVTVDINATREAIWQAKRQGNIFARYNPLSIENVPLVAGIDTQVFQKFLDDSFAEWTEDMVETQLVYNEETKVFDVVPGTPGVGVNAEETWKQIGTDDLLANPRLVTVGVGIGEVKPFVTEDMAQRAKELADGYLGLPMKFYIDNALAWTVDPLDKASFLKFELNKQRDALNVIINRSVIETFVNDKMVYGINSSPTNKKVLVNQDGIEKRVLREGREGVQLLDTESYINVIHSSMERQKGFDVDMKVKKLPFSFETTIIDDTRWIEYNISNYCVYLHQRDEVIWSTCNTSNGKPSTPTIAGEFQVYQKTYKQCMPNSPSPYPLCDIHYVTYWGPGGYAFHQAWWMTWENGKVNIGLSHGCVNMFMDDAKTVYDFAEIGTRVWVHY